MIKSSEMSNSKCFVNNTTYLCTFTYSKGDISNLWVNQSADIVVFKPAFDSVATVLLLLCFEDSNKFAVIKPSATIRCTSTNPTRDLFLS